jgi:excinuclease ABC subunit A
LKDYWDVIKYIEQLKKDTKIVILIEFKQHAKRDVKEELNILVQKGFSRLVNGEWEIGNRKKNSESTTYRIEELLEDEKLLKQIFTSKKSLLN